MKLRKLFALLMAAVMLLGMMPMANAEPTGCNHDWDSGKWLRGAPSNCQDWKPKTYTCTICGATATNEECGPCVPGSKTWIRPQGSNCQEYGVWEITCRYCGERLESGEEPGPHKWRETIVEEPWCDVGGMKAMICSVCGEWQGNGTPLNPLGHNWGSWSWAQGSAPSCTEGAWQVRECKRCGQMEDRYVEAGSHKFGEWITTEEPTCTERGRHHHKCTVCGYSEWEPIPTVDHIWGEWHVIEEPQVGIPGTERRACTFGCGTHEDREIPALEEALELPGLELTLTLDSTPANGEYFVVGEQVVFTAPWANRSPFELFPFYVSIWPYEQPSLDSQDLPYSCSYDAEEPVTTGMTGSHSMVITVTEEDVARGGIYAMAFISSTVHNGPEVEEVTTPFVTAPCGVEETSYATSIELEVLDIPSVTAEWAGDVYTVKVRVTNTGDTTVDLRDFAFVDANGNTYLNAILYDWNKYAIDPPCDWLPAGASLTTDLEFAVTQSGIAAGELRFNLVQYAAPWYAQVGDQYTNTPADVVPAPEGTTGYYVKTDAVVSDTVEIVVPINQGTPEFDPEGLTVTKTASAGSYSDPCKPGDVVTFTITVTNNTGVELTDVEITDPIKGGNEDSVVDIIPAMQPGESVTASFSYTVTEEDATVGVEGFENTAYASGYTADGTQVSGTSNTIFVWCVIEHSLTFFKSIANVPANGVYFVPGETIVFNISMFNHTPYPLYNITLTDPLCQDQYIYDAVNNMSYLFFGELYPEGNAMGESTSATVTVSYVVTEADAEAGSVTNTAEVTYQTWYGKEITDSDGATAPCGPDSDGAGAPVVVTKAVANTPANGEYFVNGETITFSITVTNNTGEELGGMIITDPLDADWICEVNEPLLPGESRTESFSYVVTWMDANAGSVQNYATVRTIEAEGYRFVVSNTVSAPCGVVYPVYGGVIVDPFGVVSGLEVIKEVESLPLNGLYYEEGETIAYKITYTNIGETRLGETLVYDPLFGMTEMAYAEGLDPNESRTAHFNYTVTAADVARGFVYNQAVATFDLSGYLYTSTSNEVVVDTDGQPDPVPGTPEWPTFTIVDPNAGAATHCVTTLTGWNSNSISTQNVFCPDHAATQDTIAIMMGTAADEASQARAYEYAINLWQADLERMYNQLISAADPASRVNLVNEYVQFCAWAGNYRTMLAALYPNQPVLAAKLACEAWQQKCIGLCGEVGTAPAQPTDSLFLMEQGTDAHAAAASCGTESVSASGTMTCTDVFCGDHSFLFGMTASLLRSENTAASWERIRLMWQTELNRAYNDLFAAAGPAAQPVVIVERNMFENWLQAREAQLTMLYPDNPEIVAELLTREIITHVSGLCEAIR